MKLPNIPSNYVTVWIGVAAGVGALISATDKLSSIMEEPEPTYRNRLFERPMRGVYHTTRVASHAGMGAAIAGATAATAPVSIPLYCLWKLPDDKKANTN